MTTIRDNADERPPLPEGWVWTPLGMCCQKPQYGTGLPVLHQNGICIYCAKDSDNRGLSIGTVPFCQDNRAKNEKTSYRIKRYCGFPWGICWL